MAARASSPAAPDEAVEIENLRSHLKELAECAREDLLDDAGAFSNPKDLIEDCLAELLAVRHEIELDDNSVASLGPEDSEAFLEQLKRELTLVEDKEREIDNEIMGLIGTVHEDSARFYGDLGALDCSLKLCSSLTVRKSQGAMFNSRSVYGDHQESITYACEDEKFKILQLDHQIEEANCYLTSLKNLESAFRRDDAIGQVEEMLSEEVKSTEFEGNWIRLSIGTPISTLNGSVLAQQLDSVIDPLVLHHELAIEVTDETMELKNIEIFPNDVCLDNIISAPKSSRQLFSMYSAPSFKSSLEWLVRKVKQQIFLCNIRRLLVKDANNSRCLFEYSDKDETVIAHLVRGIDAVIKVPQGWPVSPSALHLVSIKSSDIHLKGFPISFFYKIQELANSLDAQIRCHISRFADSIDEIFVQEMHQRI